MPEVKIFDKKFSQQAVLTSGQRLPKL